MFFLAKRFLGKVKIHYLMMVAAAVTISRWILLANITNPALFIFEQCLHSFSFAMTHFAMIRYISSQEVEKIAKLQGLYFGLSNCAIVAVFTFISGLLYQYNPSYMFILMAICASLFPCAKKISKPTRSLANWITFPDHIR